MATDNLTQLGKRLRRTRNDISHVERYTAQNHPLVEEVADIVGPINTFRFEFKTYGSESAKMDLIIRPKFKQV